MKKNLVLAALALAISMSIIAGTLAMYVVEIDDLAEGSLVAKEFILLEGGTDTFEDNVKIAPGETVDWTFSVRNYDGTLVSETAMDLVFSIDIAGITEDNAIEPLIFTVKDKDQTAISTETNTVENGVGTITFTDEFQLDDDGQEKTYTVHIEWPWETQGVDDTHYAGEGYGTLVKVSVTGTQQEAIETD